MKVLRILIKVFIYTFVFFNITVLTLYFIGIQPTIITTGSMIPKLSIGTVCFVDKNYSFADLEVDDIIAYHVPRQKDVVHRIVEKVEDGYRTKGDSNENADTAIVDDTMYAGKCIFYIPYLGYLISIFQPVLGRILLIVLIIVLFSLDYILSFKVKNKF